MGERVKKQSVIINYQHFLIFYFEHFTKKEYAWVQDLIKYSIIATFQTKVWQQNTIFVYTSWNIVWTRPSLCGTVLLIRERENGKFRNRPFYFFPLGKLVRFVSTVSKYNLHIEKDEGKFRFLINHILFNFLPGFLHPPKIRRSEDICFYIL